MQALNCLIVEDEPLAAGLISDYIADIAGLTLKGVCYDALSAIEKLREEKIDLIFLDINLPKISGIEFLSTIKNKYHVIFTTAYHQYAIQGFELNAVDYLLKPVAFSRFMEAVQKVFGRTGHPLEGVRAPEKKHHFFNSNRQMVKVFEDEILYIESIKDYVRIQAADKKIVTKFRISELEKILDPLSFVRIHKSFIVNTGHILSYSPTGVQLPAIKLPVGRTFRSDLDRKLNNSRQ